MRATLTLTLLSLYFLLSYEQVSVKIFSPEELGDHYKNKNMSLTLANYGYVPYGKSLIGTLHLASPRNGCLPLEPFMTNNSHSDPSPIVVMERGGCHFVTKTNYAQLIGAKLALIIDNKNEDEDYVIMIDDGDGLGQDISIPTIMISKNDGKTILSYLKSSQNDQKYSVALSFHFEMPNPNDTVQYELWMSSMDKKSYDFLQSFQKYQETLGNAALFRPHYALWFCPMCKNVGFKNSANENCVSNGRYCAPDPDGPKGPLTGQEVVLEDLRQLCLYSINNLNWWNYVVDFADRCLNSTSIANCSRNLLKEKNFNVEEIEKCVNDTFVDGNIQNDNQVLMKERTLFLGEGIQIWPSIRINNVTYRGNLVPSIGVFDAICEGMQHPIEKCLSPTNIDATESSKGGSGSVVGVVLLVIFALLVFMIIIMIFYKRWMRQEISKDIQMQVNTTISQYFALREERKV